MYADLPIGPHLCQTAALVLPSQAHMPLQQSLLLGFWEQDIESKKSFWSVSSTLADTDCAHLHKTLLLHARTCVCLNMSSIASFDCASATLMTCLLHTVASCLSYHTTCDSVTGKDMCLPSRSLSASEFRCLFLCILLLLRTFRF